MVCIDQKNRRHYDERSLRLDLEKVGLACPLRESWTYDIKPVHVFVRIPTGSTLVGNQQCLVSGSSETFGGYRLCAAAMRVSPPRDKWVR